MLFLIHVFFFFKKEICLCFPFNSFTFRLIDLMFCQVLSKIFALVVSSQHWKIKDLRIFSRIYLVYYLSVFYSFVYCPDILETAKSGIILNFHVCRHIFPRWNFHCHITFLNRKINKLVTLEYFSVLLNF